MAPWASLRSSLSSDKCCVMSDQHSEIPGSSPVTHHSSPLPFPLFLAPMAGVTNTIFRQLCRQRGADVLTSEFVSAEGITHRNERTREYLDFEPGERPVGVQLFGGDPDHLAEAAKQVVDWVKPDFIDLNFGCPVNKVVCKQGGSALLKDCPLLERVASAVVRAVAPMPVTAKIRIGWNAATVNAPTVARILESTGIQRLAVHGRTKEQGYTGLADWTVIAEVADAVKIPVIGNGDISNAADALKHRSETNVSGLMIGRAAMTIAIPPSPSDGHWLPSIAGWRRSGGATNAVRCTACVHDSWLTRAECRVAAISAKNFPRSNPSPKSRTSPRRISRKSAVSWPSALEEPSEAWAPVRI
jgi:nifR3 family TIM-barrel protein